MARQPFNTRWAQGVESQDNLSTFKAPGDVRLASGWEGGQDKDAPPAGNENWWHNRVDSALQGVERQGVMSWHAQAVYGLGAPCYASDGYYYDSLVAGNVGNDPLNSPTVWRQLGQSLFSPYSVGEYKDVAHNGSPDIGWLKSNGAVLLRVAYPKLFAMIGTIYNIGGELSTQFRLPDWRGMFGRGLDDGRGIDVSRALGNTVQPSQNLVHSHDVNDPGHVHGYASSQFGTQMQGGGSNNYAQPVAGNTGSATTGISIQPSGGAEARPNNLAFVRWIRYL